MEGIGETIVANVDRLRERGNELLGAVVFEHRLDDALVHVGTGHQLGQERMQRVRLLCGAGDDLPALFRCSLRSGWTGNLKWGGILSGYSEVRPIGDWRAERHIAGGMEHDANNRC